jgi:hypothetical protein
MVRYRRPTTVPKMNTDTHHLYQRLEAALEAQCVSHWLPMLRAWLENNNDWWQTFNPSDTEQDPAILEIIELVETSDADTDSAFALALANIELARRRAIARHGIHWHPADGSLNEFREIASEMSDQPVQPYYDVITPTTRLAMTLLGWMIFQRDHPAELGKQ